MATPAAAQHYAILFTDLVNSSVINHRLKDRAYKEKVLNPHLEILENAITTHGGRLGGPPAGDSVLGVFDDVPEALAAAENMQRDLTGLTFEDNEGKVQPVQIRVGIHYSQEPLTWDPKYLLAGHSDANFASRVQSSANPAQILLSQRARDRVTNPNSDFKVWPNRRIKSFTETPAALHERLWDGATKGEPGSTFLPVWFRVRNQYIPRPALEQRILTLFQERAPGGSLFRLITLHGFGGAGKTRLAVQCCLDAVGIFEGRVFYAGLEAVPASDESDQETRQNALAAAIAAAFGLEGDSALSANLGRSLPVTVCLLLLDNFETVDCDAAADLLFALLDARPELHLLVTGREMVKDVDAEKVLFVGGLEPEQARELLLARIRLCEGRDRWNPTEADETALSELLRLTECHPLSIELVAAHAGKSSLREIAASLKEAALSDVTAVPERGRRRDGQIRHKSLRYCLDWSWDRLPPGAQEALTCLGLFPDRFISSDALACFPHLLRGQLDRLVDAALLNRSEDSETGESIYALLRPTREYAELQRVLRPDPESPVLTFIARYRVLMEQHRKGVHDHDQTALRALDGCHANSLAAFQQTIALRSVEDADALYSTLGWHYRHRAKYANNLLVEQTMLQFRKETLQDRDPDIAISLNNLAMSYYDQGRYAEAEVIFRQALEIRRAVLPEGHPDIAVSLTNLSSVYVSQGRYDEAEPLHRRALDMKRTALEDHDPAIATSLNNLAMLCYSQGKYAESEVLHHQALQILRTALPDGHPDIATSLSNLAGMCYIQGKYAEAEPLLKEALEMRRTGLPDGHPDVALSINNLAVLYATQERHSEAELLHKQALEMRCAALPAGHPDIGESLANLARLYECQGRYEEAEPLVQRTLEIRRSALPKGHPDIAIGLNSLAFLYYCQERYQEAEPLYSQALEIGRAALPEDHPNIAMFLNNLALVYDSQDRYQEAEPLFTQALEIRRRVLPDGHPEVATSLSNLALLYDKIGRHAEAETLYRQALEIERVALGEKHSDYGIVLNNLARLYRRQGRYAEAEPLYQQAVAICMQALGAEHPTAVLFVANHEACLREMSEL